MTRVIVNIILLTILHTIVTAQISSDSLVHTPQSFAKRGVNTSFEKHLNIYTMHSLLNYNVGIGKLFFGLKEDFGSTIIKSSDKNIRDEHYFSFLSEYELMPMLKFGWTVNNDIYSDNRSLAINQVSITQSTLYSRITPYNKIDIVPFAGISNNKQIGETDMGYIYGAEIGIDSLHLNDFDISSIARFSNEDISPRQNITRLATIKLSNRFENSIANRFSASYNEQKKDFYFATDSTTQSYFDINNNIQSRTEKNYYLQDQLVIYPSQSNFLFTIFGRIDWRNIDRDTRYRVPESISTNSFDTNIEEYKINFLSSLQYNFGNLSTQLRISYLEREEKHFAREIENANQIFYERRKELEFQKNNKSQQTTVSLAAHYAISGNDLVTGSILQRKIVYDTPSDLNFDDRDELLTIFEIEYRRKLNSLTDIFLKLDGSINHLVYIFAERSSNNNIRRVLSFTSGTSFTGQRFRNTTTASVLADYTVYDFREYNPLLRNFSFRRFSVSDSSSFSFTRKFSLNLDGYLRLSEQGDFNWNNFSNHPSRYLKEIYIEPTLRYVYKKFVVGAGIKYFSLSTYGYENLEKVLQTEYISLGPTAEIIIRSGKNLYLYLNGWYEFISTEDNASKEMANFNLRLNWTL